MGTRPRITRQLNKGESLHALRRDLCYALEGKVRHRHHEDQSEQVLCLSVVTNAIVAWTTEYLGLAVAQLRTGGRRIDDEVLAHVSPAHNENIGFYGTFSFEVATELAQLVDGYRSLPAHEAGVVSGSMANGDLRRQSGDGGVEQGDVISDVVGPGAAGRQVHGEGRPGGIGEAVDGVEPVAAPVVSPASEMGPP